MKIVCSGYLVRMPVGGLNWHHLQYLAGFRRLGHEVTFFEHFGWPDSCYDPARNVMIADSSYGVAYLEAILRPHGLDRCWCYLAEDGTAYGMSRDELAQRCRECDLYLNLSNINWIPELEHCRRRALVDTDPVFTQIGAHGFGGPFSAYHVRFTYGENVHRAACDMPTRGVSWLPTRQPVVLDLWPWEPGNPAAAITTVMNWTAYGGHVHDGRYYGQKDRQFEPFFELPQRAGVPMEIAVDPPDAARKRLREGGWKLADPAAVSRTPATYQQYLRASRAEFCVAKHGYVTTRCGWFSDRSAGYLASGRPVVVEDTGFSDFLPCGRGVIAFRSPQEALAGIEQVNADYVGHCRAARAFVEEYFDAAKVLSHLLEKSL